MNQFKRRWVYLSALIFTANSLTAQTKILNFTAHDAGDKIELTYDLLGESSSSVSLMIKLYAAMPGQRGVFEEVISCTGDIGSGVVPGKSRRITWNVFEDFETVPAKEIKLRLEVYTFPEKLRSFTWVDGGNFIMGSDDGDEDARPAHQVRLDGFYIEKTEVTVGEYRRFCEKANYTFPAEPITWNADHPMTFISWYDAKAYCQWLSKENIGFKFRLPTEAEWEYAAKSGKYLQDLDYSGSNNINDVGWYKENSIGTMHSPVGKLKPNRLGIFDMTGNVWEWCSDWYNSKYYAFSASINPPGPSSGKVKSGRGGSWFNKDVKTNFRYFITPTSRTNYLGFRVICEGPGINPILVNSLEISHDASTLRPSAIYLKKKARPPAIEIIEPRVSRGEKAETFGKDIVVKGRVTSDNKILMVLVGGMETRLDDQGYFEKSVSLKFEDNTIVIRTYDVEKNLSTDSVHVYRALNREDVNKNSSRKGTDFALLIGTDRYDEFESLSNPILDIETVGNELRDHYGFEIEKVRNPTLENFYNTIRSYSKRKYAKDDQLFIFIAGHGIFDNLFGDGYLALTDSKKLDVNKTGFVSHSNLRTILNNIECNHIFLVLDVCFGGTFDPVVAKRGEEDYEKVSRTEFINRKLAYKSRLYLTSGGKEYVSDGKPGSHSPFTREFLKALRTFGGADQVLTIGEILGYIEKVKPEPRFGEFGSNEPGSDFLFVLKQ